MSVIKEGEETIVRLQQNIFAPSSQAQQLERAFPLLHPPWEPPASPNE
jgi:hypothetical protein